MNKIEIVSGSLKISKDGIVLLLLPKDSIAMDVLSLDRNIPLVLFYNKYLANFTELFSQPLSSCVDVSNVNFTKSTIISFAENNLGF